MAVADYRISCSVSRRFSIQYLLMVGIRPNWVKPEGWGSLWDRVALPSLGPMGQARKLPHDLKKHKTVTILIVDISP